MHVRRSVLALLTAVLAATPLLAAAQYAPPPPPPPGYAPPPPPSGRPPAGPLDQGLVLGLRLGYGSGTGAISNDVDATTGAPLDPRLGDLVDSKIPIWLELGWRFNPNVWGGLFLELAPVNVSNNYCGGVSCSGSNVRFGADVQFHLQPRGALDPWLGVGFGFEVLNATVALPTSTGIVGEDVSYSGLELPLLEAGLDLAVTPHLALGPYVSWSLGRFTNFSYSAPGFADQSGSIQNQTTHSWFEIGVKGTLKL